MKPVNEQTLLNFLHKALDRAVPKKLDGDDTEVWSEESPYRHEVFVQLGDHTKYKISISKIEYED